MREPTFPTHEAAAQYGRENVAKGFAASYMLQRVPGELTPQPGLPGIRLAAVRYAAVLLDGRGRKIREYVA